MKTPLIVALLLMIALLGLARADIAKVADLKADERIEVEKTFFGNVGLTTKFKFTADKVVVESFDKKPSEVKLTESERAAIDRHLDSVRNGKRGNGGEGNTLYKIRFFKKDRERKGLRESVLIVSPGAAVNKALTLEELVKRAGK
jgi:hypothetical protein